SNAELTVKVTGYQWKWEYEYLGEGVSFYSDLATPRTAILNQEEKADTYLLDVDNPLVLPTNTKIRFHHTSADVIHSWWVPALSVKKDAIPGFVNTNWAYIEEPGTYRGKCTELCGRDHGFMPVVVEAVPRDEFDAWLAEQKQANAAPGDDTLVADRE
ncbi:MAG: cytochrome c oxidase subunit II, partial [Halofilum sp. (in: g-proteobacteria)]|nr:cytochrome c oxidase subunit II [Halofilum sp. (in: g-proteobacteria)]